MICQNTYMVFLYICKNLIFLIKFLFLSELGCRKVWENSTNTTSEKRW